MFSFDRSTFRLSAACTLSLLRFCSYHLNIFVFQRSELLCFLCQRYHTRSMCPACTFVSTLTELEVSRCIGFRYFSGAGCLVAICSCTAFCSSSATIFLYNYLHLRLSPSVSLRSICFPSSSQHPPEKIENLICSVREDVFTDSILSDSIKIILLEDMSKIWSSRKFSKSLVTDQPTF